MRVAPHHPFYTVVNTRLLMACRARSMLPLVASTAATVEPCIKSSRSNSGVRGLRCEHSPGGRGGPIQRENFLGTTSCRTCLLQKCATSVDIPATLDHGTLCQTIDAYASVRAGRQSFIEFSGKQRRLGFTEAARLEQEREHHRALHFMRCPKCGSELQEVSFGDVHVHVDKCFACEGLWLDNGRGVFRAKAESCSVAKSCGPNRSPTRGDAIPALGCERRIIRA
jgi:hypothetical protein